MGIFCLLCRVTVCIQYLWWPEEGVWSPGLRVTVGSEQVLGLEPESAEEVGALDHSLSCHPSDFYKVELYPVLS